MRLSRDWRVKVLKLIINFYFSVTDGQLLKLLTTKVKLESICSYNRRNGANYGIQGVTELTLNTEQDNEVSRILKIVFDG